MGDIHRGLVRLNEMLESRNTEILHLRALVKQGEAVVEDFMPNIGRCALQDYGRLNTFLVEAAKVPAPSEDHAR